MPLGDCFQAAFRDLLARPLNSLLVHGLPVNRLAEHRGRRYWHAWVETAAGLLVRDTSNDRTLIMARHDYYALGQITEQHVYRYRLGDAFLLAERHRHYGPWVDGWQDLSDL